jgi:hypothetical protein
MAINKSLMTKYLTQRSKSLSNAHVKACTMHKKPTLYKVVGQDTTIIAHGLTLEQCASYGKGFTFEEVRDNG